MEPKNKPADNIDSQANRSDANIAHLKKEPERDIKKIRLDKEFKLLDQKK